MAKHLPEIDFESEIVKKSPFPLGGIGLEKAKFRHLTTFSVGIFVLVLAFLTAWVLFVVVRKAPVDLSALPAQEGIKLDTEFRSSFYTQLKELASIFFTPLIPILSLLIGYVIGEKRGGGGSD